MTARAKNTTGYYRSNVDVDMATFEQFRPRVARHHPDVQRARYRYYVDAWIRNHNATVKKDGK